MSEKQPTFDETDKEFNEMLESVGDDIVVESEVREHAAAAANMLAFLMRTGYVDTRDDGEGVLESLKLLQGDVENAPREIREQAAALIPHLEWLFDEVGIDPLMPVEQVLDQIRSLSKE